MKLSSNSIGMLIFIALATAVFALMVLRPAVDGNAMNLGIPMTGEMATVDNSAGAATTEASSEKTEDKESEAATENTSSEADMKKVDEAETDTAADTNTEESSMTKPTESKAPNEDTSTESTTTN